MGQGEGRKLQLLKARPPCREGDMLLSRDAEGLEYSQGCEAPSPGLSWHHLLPCPWCRSRVIRRSSLLGQRGMAFGVC